MYEIHVDALQKYIEPLSMPVAVFTFDFRRADTIPTEETVVKSITFSKSGQLQAFVMWWDMTLNPGNVISTAPGKVGG